MKKTISPESAKMDDLMEQLEAAGVTLDMDVQWNIRNVVSRWYASQNTLSDILKIAGRYERQCPTCERRNAIDKLQFNAQLIPHLVFLVKHGGQLSLREIDSLSGLPDRNVRSLFAGYRHWNLIERDGTKYKATLTAKLFITNDLAIPEHVWIYHGERVEPPSGVDSDGTTFQETDGDLKKAYEMVVTQFDLQKVLNDAVSSFAAKPQFCFPDNFKVGTDNA